MNTRTYIAAITLLALGQAQANEASNEIQRFANEICGPEIDLRSNANSIELGVNAETKLTALLGKLADLSVAGSAKLKQEKTSGILQKDLAGEIVSRRDCVYKVFDRLSDGLNIFSPSTIEFKKVFNIDLPIPNKPARPNTALTEQLRDPRSPSEKCKDSSVSYNGS